MAQYKACASYFSVPWRHSDLSNLGRRGFILAYISGSLREAGAERELRQEPGDRNHAGPLSGLLS